MRNNHLPEVETLGLFDLAGLNGRTLLGVVFVTERRGVWCGGLWGIYFLGGGRGLSCAVVNSVVGQRSHCESF